MGGKIIPLAKTPWRHEASSQWDTILDADGVCVVRWGRRTGRPSQKRAIAEHIVSCVNACKGLNSEAIPELLEACKFLLARCLDEGLDVVDGPYNKEFVNARAAIAKAERKT